MARYLGLLVAIGFFCTSICVAEIAPLEDLSQEIHEKREQYLKEDQKSRTLKSHIYKVAKQLEKFGEQEASLQRDMQAAQNKISIHLIALKEKEKSLNVQRKQIGKKLRKFSSWHKNALGDMVFSSQSGNDLDKRLYYLKKIVQLDVAKMETYKQDMEDYTNLRSSLKEKLVKLASMKDSLNQKQSQMLMLKNKQQKLLAEASRVKADVLGVLKNLRKKDKLTKDSEEKLSFFEQKRRLELPIQGKIIASFGSLSKENKRVSLFSNSLDLLSQQKQFVRVVFPGTVVFAENLLSYGKSVVVDHGDNFYTVYSNLKYIRVKSNDSLKVGEAIGDIGGSAEREKNILQFQIRHFSEAIDPEKWIKKNQLNLAKYTNESTAL